jgi:uncharacterized delta-60 repeat protein
MADALHVTLTAFPRSTVRSGSTASSKNKSLTTKGHNADSLTSELYFSAEQTYHACGLPTQMGGNVKKSIFVLTILLTAAVMAISISGPQPGDLDPTFDGDGKLTDPFASPSQFYSVITQPDGKIVALGWGNRAVLARYNPDGSPDTTFGGGSGKVTTSNFFPHALAIQADGKIVAAGTGSGMNADFALTRYNTDGSLDTSFDGDGRVITPIGTGYDYAYSVAIGPDGKIVAAGNTNDNVSYSYFALAVYNTDGSLDTSFNGDGKVITPEANTAYSVAVQADGKIVAAGLGGTGTNNDFALARYNTDGSLDSSFDSDGIVITAVGTGHDIARSVVIQPDGKIVAAGSDWSGPDVDFAVVRYNTDGSLDTSFDGDGKVRTPTGTGNDYALSVAIQPDGKIVAAGNSNSNNDFGIVRYNPIGSLDVTFGGGDGISTVDFENGSDEDVYGMALDVQGRAVVVGQSSGLFAIARFIIGPG